ncbi:hypothetical protein CAPTEDRAFT_183693 [Capitella teleta]|uniref:Fe2OG dioxygenase domain-containing protein n=1 Tax=Capitella teleta TaxID=283909 RepID=R7TLI4_CAPTE|nr:hypothetical protein CAPTEDRAFT_183693 [Capitella teleta]|eukprot:ELT91970.1 hypothetical protein CAPTEDRAFT_183693 [Capitella teleta]
MSTEEIKRKFADDGFVVFENFLSNDEIEALKTECHDLVEKMNPDEHNTVFSTTKQSYRDDYFINSGDKIGFFFEEGSRNEQGDLIVNKHNALNKIGHAMHVLCPNFRKVTFSEKIKDLLRNLDFQDPVVVQSMYIFKQPKIGGEVVSHQDATYLWADPLKEVGIWIALEDATLENGCLSFVPGSQKKGLLGNYRMVRNPEENGPSCVYTGEKPDYSDGNKFVPVPVKKGDMILIDGLVIHRSEKNESEKSRHIYTFHIYDHAAAQWSDKNWMQPTEAKTFTHVYDVQV